MENEDQPVTDLFPDLPRPAIFEDALVVFMRKLETGDATTAALRDAATQFLIAVHAST